MSWSAIFLKAYGMVAQQVPELRRAYLTFPYPRLYQHPGTIASVAVERDYQGEKGVFHGRIQNPHAQTLSELDACLRRFKTEPVESFARRALRITRLPTFLRRGLWWWGLNVSGSLRARRFGTFGLSVYSSLGAESLHPLSPLTTTLNYGVIQEGSPTPVRIVYDHRVMDGSTVARALTLLEQVLHEDIVQELAMKSQAA